MSSKSSYSYHPNHIRNFSIIAHVDHGKSTLADCILAITHAIDPRDFKHQFLDQMDLEQERGITIKLNSVTLKYDFEETTYYLNLIDTPGHVDFSYEVSRSLAACEGALLVVDASQGIQAQTLKHLELAQANNLVIIPIINKIDLATANVVKVKQELSSLLAVPEDTILCISAKHETNINLVMARIIRDIPAPQGKQQDRLQALIFDSYYDKYLGVIIMIRIFAGRLRKNSFLQLMSKQQKVCAMNVGLSFPTKKQEVDGLRAGEIGWIYCSMKKISQVTVGDTITDYDNPAQQRLQGYLKQQPVVFCAVFPEDSSNYGLLTSALKKINLSDSSFTFKKMASDALGFGFHCGFIGNLHMEIILERIRREHHLVLITTAPCVEYHLGLTNNQKLITSNPSDFPEPSRINTIAEPIAEVKFLVDVKYLGKLISFLETKRGVYKNFQVITTTKQILIYEMPLNEVIFDFFGQIKALSKGFISYSYGFSHYQPSKLSKVDILINHNVVSPLSSIFPTSQAAMKARKLCLKLKANIPRQNIEIIIQAAINKKIIARETIKAVRKDVIAGLYGGDISRKKKLLQKQKKGKKNRTKFGKVSIPHQAFLAALKP